MARIRSLKPEFWSSPGNKGTDPWARLLYAAMWNWADDFGRGTANAQEIHSFAFPLDDDPLSPPVTEAPRLLKEVQCKYSVVFYEVSGRRYYAILSWEQHNRHERRAKSKYPAPEEGVPFDPCPPDLLKQGRSEESPGLTDDLQGTSLSVQGSSVTGTGEQGNRGTGEKDLATAAAPAVTEPDLFEDFWASYPRKAGKAAARKAWPKAKKKLEPARLVKAAEWWATKWEAAGIDNQFIPHASSWLNGERWTDDPPAPRRAVAAVPNAVDQRAAEMLAGTRFAAPNLRALPGGETA